MNTPANGPQRPSAPRTPAPASTETPGAESEAHRGAQHIRLDDLTSNQLDALYDRIEAARALHKPMQRGSGVYCAHCSHWDGRRVLGVLTDYPCDTLRALDGPPQPHTGPTEAPQDGPVAPSAPRSTPGGVSDPAQRHEPSDGHTATQDGLRAQVKAALRLTPRTGHTDWPPPSPHGGPDGHLYDMRCALCGSDVNALADAVLSVRDAELARLRAELAKLRAVSRGYCPHCGRGDCAPRLEDWEHERARAEQAEAAIARVREIAERWRYVHDRKQASEELRAALNPPKENQP